MTKAVPFEVRVRVPKSGANLTVPTLFGKHVTRVLSL